MAEEFEGKVIADKFVVGSLIKWAELGDIYSGRHQFMEKPVTLKILPSGLASDETIANRFFDEARAASRVSHPNILNLTDFGSSPDGTKYSVYEGLIGETLHERIKRAGQMSVDSALDIALQIATGLNAAHSADLIHGNLASDNILVSEDYEGRRNVKIFDFGASNPFVEEQPENEIIASDFAYMTPEQCSGSETPDARWDTYALGVLLYEMLAGEQPFTGEKPSEVMLKHTEELPSPLSAFRHDLPSSVEPVVLKALSKDPDLRYQTAMEFADAIDEARSNASAKAASANNSWKTAFIVLAGITLLSVFFIYATSSKETDPATALQTDANGQPVQPINPATGAEEQSLAAMPGAYSTDANSTMAQPPGTLPGGDGYNAWGNGGAPPPGAPTQYVSPGGQVYTIDPNNPSQFMPMDGGVVLVPIPANTNTAAKPTPTPKTPAANANTATSPAANTAVKPTPTPGKEPIKTPSKPPANTKPAASGEPKSDQE
jgi:serine/threonine protein kinase